MILEIVLAVGILINVVFVAKFIQICHYHYRKIVAEDEAAAAAAANTSTHSS